MSEASLYPIIDFDPDRDAIIRPFMTETPPDFPELVVMCFFKEVVEMVAEQYSAKTVYVGKSEVGEVPYYEITYEGERLGFYQALVGAPLAVGFMEKAIAMGSRKFIACGGSGVLNPELAVGHLLIPTAAVRDEGTSYHYLPPSREAYASPTAVAALEAALRDRKVDYRLGKSWTTDAFYRETLARRARRAAEGCIVVEMEASAFFALAQFRGVTCGQVVYGGDLVSPEGWDFRDWVKRGDVRTALFWLAVDACSRLESVS